MVAAREEASLLVHEILEAMLGDASIPFTEDMQDLCILILGYLDGMLEDEELMAYLDPRGCISLDRDLLAKASSILELLAIAGGEGGPSDGEVSEGEEVSDLNVQGIGDAG